MPFMHPVTMNQFWSDANDWESCSRHDLMEMLGAMVVLALPALAVRLGIPVMAYRRRGRSAGS